MAIGETPGAKAAGIIFGALLPTLLLGICIYLVCKHLVLVVSAAAFKPGSNLGPHGKGTHVSRLRTCSARGPSLPACSDLAWPGLNMVGILTYTWEHSHSCLQAPEQRGAYYFLDDDAKEFLEAQAEYEERKNAGKAAKAARKAAREGLPADGAADDAGTGPADAATAGSDGLVASPRDGADVELPSPQIPVASGSVAASEAGGASSGSKAGTPRDAAGSSACAGAADLARHSSASSSSSNSENSSAAGSGLDVGLLRPSERYGIDTSQGSTAPAAVGEGEGERERPARRPRHIRWRVRVKHWLVKYFLKPLFG